MTNEIPKGFVTVGELRDEWKQIPYNCPEILVKRERLAFINQLVMRKSIYDKRVKLRNKCIEKYEKDDGFFFVDLKRDLNKIDNGEMDNEWL
jgi:hypothetical protein